LKELAKLKALSVLVISGTLVTDAGIPTLATFKNLTLLGLGGTGVTSKGYEQLEKALPKCKLN
jgi:hypothetical protein